MATTLETMRCGPVTVLLPCHSFDDFPTVLEEAEAEGILAAWTAAWHPAIIATAAGLPGQASVDLPLAAAAGVGIVPVTCDERFAGQADPDDTARWVRGLNDVEAITAAVAARLGVFTTAAGLPGGRHAEAFHSLGLAALLAELLARRMRTEADIAATGFDSVVLTAARAAVADDDEAVRDALAEAYGCLEATRSRYYAVDSWAVDVVLVAPTTVGEPLLRELASPVPLALVATAETVRRMAAGQSSSLKAVRDAVRQGRVEPCGGRDDQQPVDLCAPETIRDSLARGREAWREPLGCEPSCYAAITGGSSAILPQVLQGFGCRTAIWSLFDGSSLPDPAGGRIRWEGTGGGEVEAIARPPLDAGRAASIFELPDRIGDSLDHDHAAVVHYAHYAGRASRWHALIRRIGAASSLLGTFVTPSVLIERTSGYGTPASFEPDAFPGASPPAADNAGHDLLAAPVAQRRAEAIAISAAATAAAAVIAADRPSPALPAASPRPGRRWPGSLFGRRRDDDALRLDNGLVELRPHPRSGGLLSLRRPSDRGNRISQQLAVRTTAAAAGRHWESAEERAEYGRMEADAIERTGTAIGGRIESQGWLLGEDGQRLGRFTQGMSLLPGLPLAVIDLEIALDRPLNGPFFETHVACRFAWHENEDVELRRGLHLQSVVTERRRFTAPHFVEIVPHARRTTGGMEAIAILTGGLPWHVASSPHVLDSVVLAGGSSARHRLAVGLGLERPWDAAVTLAAGGLPTVGPTMPANVRITGAPALADDPPGTCRLGIVESAGRAGEVRIAFARDVAGAVAVDLAGRPLPDLPVTVAGRVVSVVLRGYQWLHLAVRCDEPVAVGPDRGTSS